MSSSVFLSSQCYARVSFVCFCRFKSFSPVLNLHSGEFVFVKMKMDLESVGGKLDRDQNAIRSKLKIGMKTWSLHVRITR